MNPQFVELYKETFVTWRFQVESYWTRNTYFAGFETAALAGDWLIGKEQHGAAALGAVAGTFLTLIWVLNCLKQHQYIRFWWAKLIEFDGAFATAWVSEDVGSKGALNAIKPVLLASDFDRWRAARRRDSIIRYDYSTLVLWVQAIFFVLWLYLFGENLQHLHLDRWPHFLFR